MSKQKTETQAKILVHEDLKAFTFPLNALTKICELANDVAKCYEELNIGPFTYGIFEDIIENDLLNIRVNYLANIRSEIKRLNIINPSIQQAFMSDIDRALKPLKTAVEALKKYSGERLNYWNLTAAGKKTASFLDNRFVITDEDVENLKDTYCRIYIDDEKQQIAFNSLENLVKAYNDLIRDLQVMNPKIAFKFTQSSIPLQDYMAIKNGEASIYKPSLNYFLITEK